MERFDRLVWQSKGMKERIEGEREITVLCIDMKGVELIEE